MIANLQKVAVMTILEYSEFGKDADVTFSEVLRELQHENLRLQHLVAELLAKNERLRRDRWIDAPGSAMDALGLTLQSPRMITE